MRNFIRNVNKFMVKIASWNVNSIRARLKNLIEWLNEEKPEVLLLQETKTLDTTFPKSELEDLGYNVVTLGQKSYNGVAILSKAMPEDIIYCLPGNEDDDQARFIEATVYNKVRVASIYLPNGNPINTEKFDYKLQWMNHLYSHIKNSLESEEICVFAGDYNVIENDNDVYDPIAFKDDALTHNRTRDIFKKINNLGITNAFKVLNKTSHQYSYWDYQRGSWQKDNGLLIDHILLSPEASDLLLKSGIDRKPRGKQKASDHTPIWCELDI